jgi:hypothetical protein
LINPCNQLTVGTREVNHGDLDWCFSLKLAASLKTIGFVWEDQFFEDQPNWDTLMVTGRACSFQPHHKPVQSNPQILEDQHTIKQIDQETSNFLGSFNIFNQGFSTKSPESHCFHPHLPHFFPFFPHAFHPPSATRGPLFAAQPR